MFIVGGKAQKDLVADERLMGAWKLTHPLRWKTRTYFLFRHGLIVLGPLESHQLHIIKFSLKSGTWPVLPPVLNFIVLNAGKKQGFDTRKSREKDKEFLS